MLVLSRLSGQGCVVTDAEGNILLEVIITEIVNGHKVKIGFKAEREIIVDRDEVWRAKMLGKSAKEVD